MRRFGESIVVFAVPMALFVVVVSVIGLISEVVGIVQQTPVQRGIDARTVQVTATYTGYDDGSKFHDPIYTLSYVYEDEALSTPLRSLPGNHTIGDQLCTEIDAEQPANGRVCGTRGGLADARDGLRTGGIFLGSALLILLACWAYERSSFGAAPVSKQRRRPRPPGAPNSRKRRRAAIRARRRAAD